MTGKISDEELAGLYELARKAKAEGEIEKAREYYEKISEVDPEKWEPRFYSTYAVYYDFWTSYIIDEKTQKDNWKQIQDLCSAIIFALELIAKDDSIDKMADVAELSNVFADNFNKFVSDIKSQARALEYEPRETPDDISKLKRISGLIGGVAYVYAKMCYEFGDSIFANGLQDIRVGNLHATLGGVVSTDCWKKGNYLIWYAFTLMPYPIKKDSRNFLEKYTNLIRRYEPDYQPPVLPYVKSGCYIATCVYGSYDCPQVWILRRYRDKQLAGNILGRAFIHTYYAISPTLVRWFGSLGWFRGMWKPLLDHMVESLRLKGFEDTPYQDRK